MITKYSQQVWFFLFLFLNTDPLIALNSPSPKFGPWSAPINAGPVLNTDKEDAAPVVIDHGRTIYFTTTRAGSVNGSEDIWVATRKSVRDEWRQPQPLWIVNTASIERLRSISPDGRLMVFQSDRPGGIGGFDIWVSVRKNKNSDLGWSDPVNLGAVINSGSNEIAGNYVFGNSGRSQKFFISSARSDLGGLGEGDIYVSEIPVGGSFGPLVNVTELNSQYVETCFWVRQDGLEILFSSTRAADNNIASSFDLWQATRETEFDVWSAPVSLGPQINAEGYQDVNPFVSDDGTTMWFSSRRPNQNGPGGNMDIYFSTRIQLRWP